MEIRRVSKCNDKGRIAMSFFGFNDEEALGTVQSVDTASVLITVENLEKLRQLQVNRLVALHSSKPGQYLIGIVNKITRNVTEIERDDAEEDGAQFGEINRVRISLIGTLIERSGSQSNVFRRTLETVPEIMANCFPIESKRLTNFMRIVSEQCETEEKLSIGHYSIDEKAIAYLDGNRLFQRHALIVGSTGSGKSWTTAHIAEQVAELSNANAILFDIHGEYKPLNGDGIRHLRVAGPRELGSGKSIDDGVLYLPYWLLGYEDMIDILLDRSDHNAPNQAMVFSRSVVNVKKAYLEEKDLNEILENFTIDSPVPYSVEKVIAEINALNTQMVPGSGTRLKQGEFYGKLSRFISRLENKITDRRLGFMFSGPDEINEFSWLEKLAKVLISGTFDQHDKKGGLKIIDFSEVPSDILPVIVSLIARLVLLVQQWTTREHRHPVALFCDEAHLYITETLGGAEGRAAVRTFTRIAKEGRKYGVGLIVITQRPSEVNRTILSQCNNFISMRLTNLEDQNVVRRLLPDSLSGFSDLLPVLDVGEALIVGDACLLPSRVRVSEPRNKPDSNTVDFWDRWAEEKKVEDISTAVNSWRKQSLQ